MMICSVDKDKRAETKIWIMYGGYKRPVKIFIHRVKNGDPEHLIMRLNLSGLSVYSIAVRKNSKHIRGRNEKICVTFEEKAGAPEHFPARFFHLAFKLHFCIVCS